jgi:hypothetical protein
MDSSNLIKTRAMVWTCCPPNFIWLDHEGSAFMNGFILSGLNRLNMSGLMDYL